MYLRVVLLFCFYVHIQGEKCLQPEMVSIAGEPYLIKSLYVNDEGKISPPHIIIARSTDVVFKTSEGVFAFTKKMKIKELKFQIPMKIIKSYVYSSGEEVVISNGQGLFYRNTRREKVTFFTSKGYKVHTLAVDVIENKVYFLCYPSNTVENVIGKLYVFDKYKMRPIGNKIKLQEITGLGYNVTSITVDRGTGNIIMSSEDIEDDDKKFWSFKMLEKIDKSPEPEKNITGINKGALESAIAQASKDIVRLYEEAVMGGDLSVAGDKVKIVVECNDALKRSEDTSEKLNSNLRSVRKQILNISTVLVDVQSSHDVKTEFLKSYNSLMGKLKVTFGEDDGVDKFPEIYRQEEEGKIDIRYDTKDNEDKERI